MKKGSEEFSCNTFASHRKAACYRKIALTPFFFIVIAASAWAATPTKEKTYTLRAQTQDAVKTQGKVSAGGLEWDCKSRSCTAKSPRDAALAQDCRALAQQVGAIKSYARSGGEKLDAQSLAQCNAGLQVAAKKETAKEKT